MNYLALGDSISIDNYTGVVDGGAASQFARRLGADHFQDLTRDGRTTAGVLESLAEITGAPDVITLTAGGNDFLQGIFGVLHSGRPTWEGVSAQPLANLERVAGHLRQYGCPVIVNTVYDPTDGDNALLTPFAPGGTSGLADQARAALNALNGGIRALASRHDFRLCDLERLFHGHGVASASPWIVSHIEPNFPGASAIAAEWHRLYTRC